MHPDAEKSLEESRRLWNRITKLESDKTVLVMALEKIARWEYSSGVIGIAFAQNEAIQALEAIKESER